MKKIFSLLTIAFVAMYALSLTSCSKDDDDAINKNITLNVDETYSIGTGDDWKSENALVASVKGSTITAVCAGTTTITGSAGKINVTVKATNFNFTEPYLNFGASLSTVKNAMSGYTLLSEKSDLIGYEGKGNVVMYMYSFKNSALYMSSFVVLSKYADDLSKFLTQRYIVVTTDDDTYTVGLIDPLMQTMVILQPTTISSTVVVLVAYTKYTGSTKSAVQKIKSLEKSSFEKNEGVGSLYTQLKTQLVNNKLGPSFSIGTDF